MDANVLERLKRSAAIPSMPQVVTRFLEIIQDPEFDYQAVADVLSTDPGTAGEILRLANSPLFGVTRQITTLRQALTLLGARRIRSLVLSRYIVESVGTGSEGSLDTGYFWRRSVVAGVVAARCADSLCPECREEAFVAALLADVGVAVLAEAMGADYAPIVEQYRPYGRWEGEREELAVVGTTHGEVSRLVLEHWQLPEVICKAVGRHHADGLAGDDGDVLTRILNGSDSIAKLLCEIPQDDGVGEVCRRAADAMGVEADVLVRVLEQVEQDVTDLAQVLHIDVIPSRVYSMIAKAIGNQLVVSTLR